MSYITVNADIDARDVLEELDTDELIEELERRGRDYNTQDIDADAMRGLLEKIWMNRRTGKDYQAELNALIYGVLGKIV
jgi:hypothetical protein